MPLIEELKRAKPSPYCQHVLRSLKFLCSYSQVILNSMYGLFQMTEVSTIKLFDSIHGIVIPDEWESVDLIKQTSTLMHSSSNPSLADELLYVRKAQAIIEFCLECKSLLKAFKLDMKSPNERTLSCMLPYTCECMYLNVCTYMYIHVHTCIHACLTFNIRMYTHVHACNNVYTCTFMYIHV